ncbi:MAG TPA: antitoxin [Actinomycetes bacterium]|nr:antitoxin [Actinomycetes bacterium]
MGMFDEMKDKAAKLAREHGEKIDDAIEKAGDVVDDKTGGKHSDKIDAAQQKAREAADKLSRDNPDRPSQPR